MQNALRWTRTLVLSSVLALGVSTVAGAEPMPAGGFTSIYLSSAGFLTEDLGLTVEVEELGVTAEVFDSIFVESPIVNYGITAFDWSTLEVFHEGVGLILSAGDASVTLSDFVVDGLDLEIDADFDAAGSGLSGNAAVFDLVDCRAEAPDFCQGLDGTIAIDGLGLFLTPAALGVLEAEFNMGNPIPGLDTETLLGDATGRITLSVPEPTTAMLLGGIGLLGLAVHRPRRRR